MSVDELAKLKRNLEQRKAAEVAMELAATIASGEGKWDGDQRYWVMLRDMITERFCKQQSEEPTKAVIPSKMTDVESRRFGQGERMPFGEFVGEKVDEVPKDRLEWYAGQTFTDDLRRYLRSDRIVAEGGSE